MNKLGTFDFWTGLGLGAIVGIIGANGLAGAITTVMTYWIVSFILANIFER